ncbi:toprim domain-containing protein [Hymenobacter humi]|uniref:Toprim domain-containing protein n=1 Tax=Hymenobacter humi TaxID=1411620 RepID=A0ABW2U746_9BACT
MGYAEDRRDGFYQDALRNGFSADVLVQAGLVRKKEVDGQAPKFYDVFQDRVMFPIRDVRGRVIAFTGRLVTEPAADASYKPGKYVNSPDTVWVKGDNLYGLDLAAEPIRKEKFAYLMEGNVDVMQFHQWSMANAVAPCGTALTDNQIKLLKRYTDHVVVVPDNDPAGIKALHKNAPAHRRRLPGRRAAARARPRPGRHAQAQDSQRGRPRGLAAQNPVVHRRGVAGRVREGRLARWPRQGRGHRAHGRSARASSRTTPCARYSTATWPSAGPTSSGATNW